MAAGNAVRLAEMGIPVPLAVEIAAQISAGAGDKTRLGELGLSGGIARRLADAITTGTLVPGVLAEAGLPGLIATELATQIVGVGLPAPVFTVLPAINAAVPVVGRTITGVDGTVSNGTITARQWFFQGSPIGGANTLNYVTATSGNHVLQETATGPGGTVTANSAVVFIGPALAITGTPPASGVMGSAYNFTPTVSGGSGTRVFSFTGSYPNGLTFNTATGAIGGTLNGVGTFSNLGITVTDDSGTASLGPYSITSTAAAMAPSAPVLTAPTAGNAQLTIPAFTAPAANGSAITDYVYQYRIGAGTWTTFADGVSATPGPVTITGLTNGTAYDVRAAAVNAVDTGAWSNVVAGTPVAAAAAKTLSDISRPPLALTKFVHAWGSSNVTGVGSVKAPLANVLKPLITSNITEPFHAGQTTIGTTLYAENSNAATKVGLGAIPGEDSVNMARRATEEAANYPSELPRPTIIEQGINDFNGGNPNYTRKWAEQQLTSLAATKTANAGEATLDVNYGSGAGGNTAGTSTNAEWRYRFFRAQQLHGRLATDQRTYMIMARRLQGVTVGSGTADDLAMAEETMPYGYRGQSTNYVPLVDVVPETHTGGNASAQQAPTDLTRPEGTLSWDVSVTNQINNYYYRKIGAPGAGSWSAPDGVHGNEYFVAANMRMWGDWLAANEGFGPPFVPALKLRCPLDAANGTVVGTFDCTGNATQFDLVNFDGSAVTEFRAEVVTATSGRIVRTASGALPALKNMVILATGAAGNPGTIPSPLDVYGTRPSTVTAPTMRTVAAPGFTAAGRQGHVMNDSKKFSFAFLINAASFSNTPQLFYATKGGGFCVQLQITGAGALSLQAFDTTNTRVLTLAAGFTVPTNTDVWLVGSFDGEAGTGSVYMNETAGTFTVPVLANPVQWSTCGSASFFGLNAPHERYNGAQLLHAQGGKVGFAMVVDDYINWATAANRRALYAADGTPASRTPYAAIGGVVPQMELWGSPGDWLFGSPDGSIGKIMSVSGKARSLMS